MRGEGENSAAREDRDRRGVLHLSGPTHESFVPLSSRWGEKKKKKLPRQIPRGRVRSYPVPSPSLSRGASTIQDVIRLFPQRTLLLHKSHTVCGHSSSSGHPGNHTRNPGDEKQRDYSLELPKYRE